MIALALYRRSLPPRSPWVLSSPRAPQPGDLFVHDSREVVRVQPNVRGYHWHTCVLACEFLRGSEGERLFLPIAAVLTTISGISNFPVGVSNLHRVGSKIYARCGLYDIVRLDIDKKHPAL